MARRHCEALSSVAPVCSDLKDRPFGNRTLLLRHKVREQPSKCSNSIEPARHRQRKKETDYLDAKGISGRTRAQFRKNLLIISQARRITRGQKKKLQFGNTGVCPTTTLTPSPSSTTVATPAHQPSQGRALRAACELCTHKKVKAETPDISSNDDLEDQHLRDEDGLNGNAHCEDSEDEGAEDNGYLEIDYDRYNVGRRVDSEDDCEDSDNEDEANEHAVEISREANESDINGDTVNNEGADDCEDNDCLCTPKWSCDRHSGSNQSAYLSALKLPMGCKRRLGVVEDTTGRYEDVSSPKIIRSASRTRQSSWPGSGSGTGNAATSSRLARHPIPTQHNPPANLHQWLETFKGWTNAERTMALDSLITQCEPSQVRHMMHVIEPQFQRDFISLLPKELALYVLSFLEPKDLLRAAQTCSYWRILSEDNLLWREKCREEGIDEAVYFGSRLRRRTGFRSPCKALFLRQSQIEHNWRKGVSRAPRVLKAHDDHVITCLEFSGQRIVSGSDDNTLKVWLASTGKFLRNLVGHTGGVWSSQMSGNIIISGSTDRSLKVWNADTGVCKFTLYGHTSTVRCMSLCGNKVVSGSRDATLRVWDIETGHCLYVLMGHVAAVRCVQYDGRRVVSGAYDYTVRIWDPETETCLHTLQGHSNRVYSLQFDGVHVVSGSLDTSIRVWDVETGGCLHTLIGHQSLTSGLELKDNILVSGNADSTVKVWDISTGQCLQTLQGPNKHQSAVTCLQFNKKFVITSSDDGTVKIWDLKSGEFLRNLVSLESGGSGGVVWRLRCDNTRLVCAVGSRNGTEETKLMVLDFDVDDKKLFQTSFM